MKMAKRGRKSRFKIEGTKLKEAFLRLQISEDGRKISFREMTRTSLMEYVIGDKIPSMGIITYWTKKLTPYAPYPNKMVDESLVYRYGIDNGLIPEHISEDEFTKNTMKIKNRLDERVKMRLICEEFNYPLITINESVFSYQKIINALVYIHGEKKYKKVEKEVEKRMLAR